ncbi:MAG: DUF4251 domain-containing protein [Prevotella sp.]|jgi:hypothetical protein|nr:DUF4251 domain-containing protein [Prevotella sp.]
MDAKRIFQPITLSLMTMVILVMAGCASNKMTSQEKAVQKALLAQKITESLRQRDYQIDVSQATPDGWGRVIQLTSLYSVKVSGDTIISNLPFYGRAYSVPYGGGSGLNFTGLIRHYDETVTRKGEHILYLDVESQEDVYRYIISLFDNGKASVSVTPRQRSHIFFTGYFHEE